MGRRLSRRVAYRAASWPHASTCGGGATLRARQQGASPLLFAWTGEPGPASLAQPVRPDLVEQCAVREVEQAGRPRAVAARARERALDEGAFQHLRLPLDREVALRRRRLGSGG